MVGSPLTGLPGAVQARGSEGRGRPFYVEAACLLHMRGCSDAGPARRLLRPNPSRPHGRDTRACGRRVGGSSWQRARPERLHPFVRCIQRRRATCARSGAARATCSSCWRCCPWSGRQLLDGWSCPYVSSSCTCAAVPRLTKRGVAQPHRSPCAGQLKLERPSSAISMPLSV